MGEGWGLGVMIGVGGGHGSEVGEGVRKIEKDGAWENTEGTRGLDMTVFLCDLWHAAMYSDHCHPARVFPCK